MSETYLEPAGVLHDAIRTAFSFFDRGPYLLLKYIYQLFFNVASSEVLNGATIMHFFSRVQLIIGVFMMFQLAMSILKGIMNPDSFSDGKTGFGNIITRIVTSLVLLTLLVPINIPSPRNEYEKQINNNGLLFGTLYSLQNRILTNNTLGRLILGINDEGHNYTSWDSDQDELEYASNVFTSTIIKGFYRINLKPEEERVHEDDKEDYMINENRMCEDIDDEIMEEYSRIDADPQTIISMINQNCNVESWAAELPIVDWFTDNERYMLAYTPVLPAITAIVFIFVLLSFTIDVAVRAVKLAVLRLIAPIPIISYMDPKGGKDGAFNAWVKTLSSTYLDLFIRLGIIYFVLFLIESMMVNGIVIKNGTGVLGFFSKMAIWIGLIIFAKEAPKFMRQALGLKDSGFKLFGGVTEALGVGAMGAGAVSGAVSGAASKYQSTSGNKGKKVLAAMGGGLRGGIGGGINAGKSFYGGKEINPGAIMESNRKYAAQNYSNAADDSTFRGRMAAGLASNFGLKNTLQKLDDKMKYYNAASDAVGRIAKAFDGNGDYKFAYSGADIKDTHGNTILRSGDMTSLKDLNDLGNFYSSDGIAGKALDKAKKSAQTARFNQIRSMERSDIERHIKNGDAGWSTSDLAVYDAGHTVYEVASKYIDQPEFSRFRGADGKVRDFHDTSTFYDADSGKDIQYLDFGYAFKHDSGQAAKEADRVKNSNEYAQASANAQRVKQQQSKK